MIVLIKGFKNIKNILILFLLSIMFVEKVNSESKIIANPNCATIQLVVVLNPLHKISRIKRVVVSTYQAVSGAGQKAIDELDLQVKAKMKSEESPSDNFPHQIAFNVLPHVDEFLDNGYTGEEDKMLFETRKILHDKNRFAFESRIICIIKNHPS